MKPYFQDESVTLYHGDCLEVLREIVVGEDQVYLDVDHCLTDPPYFTDVYLRASMPKTKAGSGTPSRTGVALAKLAAGDIGSVDDLCVPIGQLLGALVKRWTIVFSDVENCHRWRESLLAGSMRYVRTGAWVKPDGMPQMSGDRPAVGFEPMTICHAQGPMKWNGGGSRATWTHQIAKGDDRHAHPCPKPEALMLELVELFTDPSEVILDPFMGSGTTGAAAKRLGRKFIGIEREEKYCEVAANRLRQGALTDLFLPAELPL